jgi:hypothetical protein
VLSEDHQTVLRRSPFSVVTSMCVDYTVDYTVEEIIGRQFSKAFSSRVVLGDRRAAFENDLRDLLLRHEPSGRFQDATRAQLLIARRP